MVQRVRLTAVSRVSHGVAGWNRIAIAIVRRQNSSAVCMYVCVCRSVYVLESR